MKIIITGNPVDGFLFHGPFVDPERASTYLLDFIGADWWIADLDLTLTRDEALDVYEYLRERFDLPSLAATD